MTRSSSSQDRPKSDLYADVTNKIVAAIEAGAATYTLPWQRIAGLPKNVASHRGYRGINTLLLWLIGNQKGYTTPYWATFKQWIHLGYPVRKGETSATVVFWKLLDQAGGDSAEPSDGGEAGDNRRPILARAYHVFNAAQVEGYAVPELTVMSEAERDAKAEAFFNHLPISVHHEGSQAFYRPSTDSVHLPEFGLFKEANSYYAVRGHESVHPTGAKHRLRRDLSGRFGSESYAVAGWWPSLEPLSCARIWACRPNPAWTMLATSNPGLRCSRAIPARFSQRPVRPRLRWIGCMGSRGKACEGWLSEP